MARDVFISHSAQDKKIAETICAALEASEIRCWVAPRDVRPGKSFPGEITRAIQQSKVMLLIFSKHSNSSEQVLREVQLAVDCHLPIVRLRIEDITLSDDLRYYLSTPQYLDALTTPLSKHIPRLEAAIRELLEQSAEESAKSAAPGPPAPVEVMAKNKATVVEEKSQIKWTPFAIAAAVFLAIAVALVLAFRSERTTETKSAAAEPTATVSVQPTPTIAVQSTPTPAAVAVVPSPTATEPPVVAPQTSKKEPLPRNNRAWQAWMDEFVHNFIASNESNDLDLAVSFYAPTVDLFEEGKKPADAIRRDVETYNARWPARRATIRGDVRLSEKAPNRTYTASFEHDYYVENASRGEWINGAVAVDLQISVPGDGIPRITSMKQKTLRREKGTMQPR
ncbi:MAG: hypothetical protein V7609_3394 [Verrucomicrobiota bacterium]